MQKNGFLGFLLSSMPMRRKGIFPLFIRPQVLFRRDAMCPPAMQDYVVPSRADDVSCSPGRISVSLHGIGVRSRTAQQAVVCCGPGSPRTCSAILCIVCLLFLEMRKEGEK
jgi:hypothetical protein